jgi:hypothetical protein
MGVLVITVTGGWDIVCLLVGFSFAITNTRSIYVEYMYFLLFGYLFEMPP